MQRKKCDLCEKGTIFGIILKCKVCEKYICSKHESEQFIKYTTSVGDEGASYYTSFNYPNGYSFNKNDFICYNCRTGNIPNTHRDKGFSFNELIFKDNNNNVITYGPLIIIICVIVAVGLFILGNILWAIFGNEAICNLSLIVIPILILFSIIIFIHSAKKCKKSWNEEKKRLKLL